MSDRVLQFLADDEGLATLEWVVLAAAVILLSAGVVSIIRPSLNTAGSTTGSKLVVAVQSNS